VSLVAGGFLGFRIVVMGLDSFLLLVFFSLLGSAIAYGQVELRLIRYGVIIPCSQEMLDE
jgi:hypothetical protein